VRMAVATITLLGQQDTANSFVNWLELTQVGGGNLDWVTSDRQDDNIFPRMQLVLVLDHLRSLPVVLDTGALEGELLNLDRHWASRLCLNHGNVVLGLRERGRKKPVRSLSSRTRPTNTFFHSPSIGTCSSSRAVQ
jgi:hypothetical protein